MEPTMQGKMFTILMGLASLFIVHVNGETSLPLDIHQKLISDGRYHDQMQKMQALKHSLLTRRQLATPPISSSPAPAPQVN